jgi:hypothetical protein
MRFLVLLIEDCLRLGIPIVASLVIWDLKPASAAEITLSDLDHAQIDVNVLVDRHVQLNGRPDSDSINNNWHLSIEGTSVNEDFFSISTDGPHAGPGNHSHGSYTIGNPMVCNS